MYRHVCVYARTCARTCVCACINIELLVIADNYRQYVLPRLSAILVLQSVIFRIGDIILENFIFANEYQ